MTRIGPELFFLHTAVSSTAFLYARCKLQKPVLFPHFHVVGFVLPNDYLQRPTRSMLALFTGDDSGVPADSMFTVPVIRLPRCQFSNVTSHQETVFYFH